MKVFLLPVVVGVLLISLSIDVQAIDDMLLYCPFDSTTKCYDGETPSTETGLSYDNGILGQGVVLDDSDRLEYSTTGNFQKEEGTISVWVKPKEPFTGQRYIIDIFDAHPYGGNQSDTRWRIVTAESELAFELYDGAHNSGNTFIMDYSSWESRWYFLTFTWNLNEGFWAYVDGQPIGFYTDEHYPLDIDSVSPHIEVGYYRDTVAHQYEGVIDELRIYDRILSDTEILEEYENITIPEPPDPPEPPCNCTELDERITDLEDRVDDLEETDCDSRLSDLEGRVGVLESAVSAIQDSITLLEDSLDLFKDTVISYMTSLPFRTKKEMVCDYMKDNDIDEYSALGLDCEVKEFSYRHWTWEYCRCE